MFISKGWIFKDGNQEYTKETLPDVSHALPYPIPGSLSVPLSILSDEALRGTGIAILHAIQNNKLPEDPYGGFNVRYKVEEDGLVLKNHYQHINKQFTKQLTDQVAAWQGHGFEMSDETALVMAALIPSRDAQKLLTGRDQKTMIDYLKDGIEYEGQGVSPVQTLVALRSKGLGMGISDEQAILMSVSSATVQKDLMALSTTTSKLEWDGKSRLVMPSYGDLMDMDATINFNGKSAIFGVNGAAGFIGVSESMDQLIHIKTPTMMISNTRDIAAIASPEPTPDDMDIYFDYQDRYQHLLDQIDLPKMVSWMDLVDRKVEMAI